MFAACGTRTDPLIERDGGYVCATADALALGAWHSCAVRSGQVWCWGLNDHGQLGLGDTEERRIPERVPGIEDAVAVAAGTNHTCVLHANGAVSCWGWNRNGQVGNGISGSGHPDKTEWDARSPVRVEGLPRATAVSAISINTCARTEDGAVFCWGFPDVGAIGDDGESDGRRPAQVQGLPPVDEMHALGCARAGESVWCWGYRPVGDGSNEHRFLPVRITRAEPSLQLDRYTEICSLVSGGRVRCWNFPIGEDAWQLTPVERPELAEIDRIDVDIEACAWNGVGEAFCWGQNFYGNLGDGTRDDRPSPVRMPQWDQVRDIELGGAHACAIRADGTVVCTGYNAAGQLGDGSTRDH
jgi:alpha-tubulin suppressor-like RCC1 family protein